MTWSPIAIIGQGCVLPGALTPEALWRLASRGEDVVGLPPEGYWGLRPERVMTSPDAPEPDRTWSQQGGYVRGFDAVFDPEGFLLPPDELAGLDPLFLWVLHAAREALRASGHGLGEAGSARIGLILGNLSYPTRAMTAFAEQLRWASASAEAERPADGRNRFMSGLPAQLAARALGLSGARSFALDAACASSLYALKSACDALHDGRADLMLAGGVNHADDLFIHVGFSALKALSRSGRSRPFHRDADGLVPAEGAGMVLLKRLDDALRAGDPILGLIRGIGQSNDGRGKGMLTPSQLGQTRAMRAAYAQSGLSPADISLIECHATGTQLGDAIEILSMSQVFEGLEGIPIGSLKSNMGHSITASGISGLIKVLAAMKAAERPATLHVESPVEALDGSPFRLLTASEPWDSDGLRRAAINNFGFGGCNAHMIVEEWVGQSRVAGKRQWTGIGPESPAPAVAIVALSAVVGEHRNDGLRDALLVGRSLRGRSGRVKIEEIELPLRELRFPPNDLKQTLPQQLLMLEASLTLRDRIAALEPDRTGVWVGMQCDSEVTRYGLRWRLAERAGVTRGDVAAGGAPESSSPLSSAGVVGAMPNIVANRLNGQFDLRGPSYTVSAEELSGNVALELAARALRAGELDAALVGAVDLCCEPMHEFAAQLALPPELHEGGDAAVMLVLKRLDDARRDGDSVLAILSAPAEDGRAQLEGIELGPQIGHAHAASGLLSVAAAVLALHQRALPAQGEHPVQPWLPRSGRRLARVSCRSALGQASQETWLEADPESRAPYIHGAARLSLYAASSLGELVARLERGDASRPDQSFESQSFRTAIISRSAEDLDAKRGQAAAALSEAEVWERVGPGMRLAPGIYAGNARVEGETAFVFTGPAGTYPQMGRSLMLALPKTVDSLAAQFPDMDEVFGWLYASGRPHEPNPAEKLWGSSLLCQIHAQVTREVLKIPTTAAIGFCAGETNALFAMGAWTGYRRFYQEIAEAGVFDVALGGEFEAVKASWGLPDDAEVDWATWRVLAPQEAVEAAIAEEPRCHLTIINAPGDVVIGGEAAACQRAVDRIGAQRCRDLGYNIAIHCPEAGPFYQGWFDLHHRSTAEVPGLRFYTHSSLNAYTVDAQSAARALTEQAMCRVDFPALIERAWQDGVRVFIEHGPRSGCSRWISRILGKRPHVAVGLDQHGVDALDQVSASVAALWCAGVSIDVAAWSELLEPEASAEAAPATLSFAGHWPPVALPKLDAVAASDAAVPAARAAQHMAPAPALPGVLGPTPPFRPARPMRNGAAASAGDRPGADDTTQPTAKPEMIAIAEGVPAPETHATTARPAINRRLAPPPPRPAKEREMIQRWTDRHARVAEIHAEFVDQQAALQSQFMSMRQMATQALLNLYRSGLDGLPAAHPEPAPEPPPSPGLTQVPGPAPVSVRAPRPGPATESVPSPSVVPAPVASPAPVAAPTPVATPTPAPVASPAASALAKPSRFTAHSVTPTQKRAPVGPSLDREQLKIHASGKISEIFGDLFAQQDGHALQVRMPEPPLLLADRITGIDAVPGQMATGTLWSESDVTPDAWYLNQGYVPVGIMIESGQADLLLISWMGADFLNKGRRAYRLLGCELTFHGRLPRPGDRLSYDIHVLGHARQDDVRLFFFEYDCCVEGQPRLSVRSGQAGFFTREELADSMGVLWSPEDVALESHELPVDPPAVVCSRSAFSPEQVRAFSEGRVLDCFGPGYELAETHTRTPRIQAGRMLFIDEITELSTTGGPWGRGYLRAVQHIRPDLWFFDGHFKNDPCMPGTLMLEGCVQAMSIYLTAMGFTLERDGWTFHPVPDELYKLQCRGQVLPESKILVCEVFVREVIAGPIPTLYADLLGTVDGLKAFHCERMGLQLVPDWPQERIDALLEGQAEPLGPVPGYDGFRFDYASLLACAWGKPSAAFGPMYAPFDGARRVARLPGPPYHFMSRVIDVDMPVNQLKAGIHTTFEYDVPPDAWYFGANGAPVMPFAVLLEAALQPCGWLASYVGCALTRDEELFFRNLDGTGTQHIEITPQTGTLRTSVTLKNLARAGGSLIVSFDVEMLAADQGDQPVYSMDTVFGFFPAAALQNQVGLSTDADYRAWVIDAPSPTETVDLTAPAAEAYLGGSARLAETKLLMIDRVTGWWPEGGEAGLGRARAVKDVDPAEWFFKAHFFQDPVQPGSLGIEAILQLLQFAMLEKGLAEGIEAPRFEAIAIGKPLTWKYRGQVVPSNSQITTDIELTEVGRDERGIYAMAQGSLWVDGRRIYSVRDMGMRIVAD